MPQLNKGGKYVFGLSAISNRREILFPAETLEQYPVQKEGRIIIFTGSKITGGFCVTSKQLLGQSKLKHILDDCPALSQYTIDEGEFVRYKGRGYTWLHISQNGVVRLPENTMRYLNLSCGDIDNELVAEAFSTLPQTEQSILILHCTLDLADGEIGNLVGMSRSAVQRHRTKALQELREALSALMPKGG